MTAKDYRLIANVLGSVLEDYSGRETTTRDVIVEIVGRLCPILQMDNPRFNKSKFKDAVFGDTHLGQYKGRTEGQ